MIHLDKALGRMREFERMKLKAVLGAGAAAASNPESSAPPTSNPKLSAAAAHCHDGENFASNQGTNASRYNRVI